LRKQVTDLTLDDLRQTPVWQFALDEEGEPGQDEAADGTRFSGFASPKAADENFSEQPTIITASGFVNFWRGMAFDERKLDEAIAAGYEALKTSGPSSFRFAGRWT
jgi:hypothetical protein